MLGDVRYLSDQEIRLPHQHFMRLPEFERGLASSPEKELRRRLCEFVRRAYRQRLLIVPKVVTRHGWMSRPF